MSGPGRARRRAAASTPSLSQRLNSLRHGFGLCLSERLRRSRGTYRETPADVLPALPAEEAAAIEALRARHGADFERYLGAATSRRNYEYLEILDRAFVRAGSARPLGGTLCDVGSANFWYARALQTFFRPRRLIGVEVEGYRRYRDGHSRFDYATGYLADLPHARFEIADYTRFDEPADVITAWFPFVSAAALLAWRLPLSLLRPAALLRRVRANLTAGGWFVMVNHGTEEAAQAHGLCVAAGLVPRFSCPATTSLGAHRLQLPVVSAWGGPAVRRRADGGSAHALPAAARDEKYSYS